MKENIFGIPADTVTMEDAVRLIREMFEENRPHLIASVNPEICMAAQKNETLRRIVRGADLGIPDGIGIVLASKLRGGRIRARVTGIDLMLALVGLAAAEGKRVFLFGAAQGVADEAAAKLREQYPAVQIAGTQHGYVPPAEEAAVAAKIAASGADIVFVGLGSPRQELFAADHGAATGARVLMVVGGSFDVISGRLQRAPEFYRRFGIEWAYRLLQQPSRARRMLVLPVFLLRSLIKRG